MGWYPIDIDHETSTANIDIHITPGFELTGSGIISRKADSWHMAQPWEGFDYTIIASPDLKQKTVSHNKRKIEVVSLGFPDADADSVAVRSAEIMDYYTRLYRLEPNGRQLRIFLFPAGGGGAYSRRNFIVCCCQRYNEWLYQLLAHETGMPVLVAEDSLSCVGEGTGKSLENIELLKRVVMTSKKLRQ